MPKNCNVCPDCGRRFKSANGLPLHRNYCIKRRPQAPPGDYFHVDHLNDEGAPDFDLDLEGKDAFNRYGKGLSGQKSANNTDSSTGLDYYY